MIKFTKKLISQFFVLLGASWLTYEIVDRFIFSFEIKKSSYYLLFGLYLFLAIFFINIIILMILKNTKKPIDKDFIKHMDNRIGSMKSLEEVDDRSIDNTHEYLLIHRQDYLDCKEGHYYSVRRLIGVNATKHLSEGLVYSESTEFKVPYENIRIIAFDTKTKERLIVKPLTDKDKPVSTHTFKILFKKPLSKNKRFDIVYSIFLPNELGCLYSKDEVMSISLVRIKKKVHNLVFNLCLDFKPSMLRVYSMKSEKSYQMLKNRISLSEFDADGDQFKAYGLGIDWSTKPYIVKWSIKKPKGKLYILQYFKGK